ncbi:MAG: TPM domain-containing protein [Planctomycetaceae bacterium]
MNRLMLLTALFSLLLTSEATAFQQIDLQRPGDKEFVRDEAGLLTAQDKASIIADCEKLLRDKATPIIVVTINDMKSHGGAGMRIETFARFLFDQWEVGHAEVNGISWNTGILLIVSRNDRKARIELGGGWKHEYDQRCKEIMDQSIIPEFKRGDYSRGIREGVTQLIAMSGGIQMPGNTGNAGANPATPSAQSGTPSVRYQPQHGSGASIHPGILIGLACLAVFTIVSIARNGSQGLAWILWAGVFGIIGYILVSMLTSHDRRSPWGGSGFGGFGGGGSSGGGFGGGSFGGGFSGGGGASGSW